MKLIVTTAGGVRREFASGDQVELVEVRDFDDGSFEVYGRPLWQGRTWAGNRPAVLPDKILGRFSPGDTYDWED